MARILSIDYGKKRTGLAVTDPLQIIAGGLVTVSTSELFDFLNGYVSKEPVERIVIGEPKQSDGSPSENMARVTQFVNRWKKARPDIPIEFYDERFTSVLAHRAMIDGGLGKKRRQDKALVDEVSATIILQSYLESVRRKKIMVLPIYIYGQPVLRKVSQDIAPDYPNLKELIANMFETLTASDGVGLAAPQIGLDIRLVVIDLDVLSEDFPEYKDFRKAYINPHILEYDESNMSSSEEGCLSLPGIHESVKRPTRIHVKYMDEDFKEHDEWVDGYLARVMQHEFDHLDAKMFIDRLSPFRRQLIKSKLKAILQGRFSCSYRTKVARK